MESWNDLRPPRPAPDPRPVDDLRISRRAGVVGGLAVVAVPLLAPRAAPTLLRLDDPVTAVRSGEVTTDSAVLWARARRPGRLMVDLASGGRRRRIRGPVADEHVDLTARVHVTDLRPGRDYVARMWFDHGHGRRTAGAKLEFSTAPLHAAPQRIVWSGDVNGQGWGIDRARGGMTTFAAITALRPDLFVHNGDTVYADQPMAASVVTDDGSTWVNELTEEVMKVAETLREFRGRHRYPLRDDNVRAFHAVVPSVVQWDDHETANNWYPGEILDDDQYTERRVDVLATRGRRAWQEYQPVPVRRFVPRGGDGFAPRRLYRRVPRGQHLDLFCLDMRSWRSANSGNDPRTAFDRGILGRRQEEWLIEGLRRSAATWKVISSDQPLSTPSNRVTDLDGPANGDDGRPLGREPEIARVLSAIKRHGVRNVVWVTTDVHYTAAHHYSPQRAAFTDFDPFWEFVSGPLAASPFRTKDDLLDGTFGPQVAFSRGEASTRLDITPRPQNQYFGQLAIAADGVLTVTLHDGTGAVLWERALEPEAT